jgi:O-antigen/teichoic acid export membrane protein
MNPGREDHAPRPESGPEPPRTIGARLESAGPLAMAAGLGINGVAAYLFLAAAGRALGAEDSGQLSVLWQSLWLIGVGFFFPLEQELSRSISARRARGEDWGVLVRQVSRFGGMLFGCIAVVVLVASPWIADALFRGDISFVLVLLFGVAGVAGSYVVRGLLAGTGRYYGYSAFYLVDAAVKALPALVLMAAAVDLPIAYALVAASGAYLGGLAPMTRGARLGPPGEPAERSALRRSLLYLVVTAFFSAAVLNGGGILVELQATPDEEDATSIFLFGLIISRIPVFFFQAAQAVVLPRLSRSAAAGDMAEFRRLLRLLLGVIAALTVVGVPVTAIAGPTVVEVMFGSDFVLTTRDMALLTLASMLMLVAMTVNQAQIALHHQHETGWPWAVATAAMIAVSLLAGDDLLLRVELGLVGAGATVAILAGVLLFRELRRPDEHREAAPAL